MPYQTGTASSPTDLLQKIATWLVSIGWTQDRNAAEGSGWTFTGHNHGNYVNLRATMNENTPWAIAYGYTGYALHMYLGTGFNGANTWNGQPGPPVGSTGTNAIGVAMNLSAGPFSNYYFFSDATADNIVVIVEKTPGLYVQLGWGLSLNKAGSYTGGAYFFGSSASYWAHYPAGANLPGYTITAGCPFALQDPLGSAALGFVRADVDSFTGKWVGIWIGTSGADQGFTGKEGDTSAPTYNTAYGTRWFPTYKQSYSVSAYDLEVNLTSQQDGRANLLPILLWVVRDGTTTGRSLLGSPPFVFYTNGVGAGFSNAQEILIGTTTYKMFPNFAVVKQ